MDGLPVAWKIGHRTINLAQRPCIMGVLNVTPDSFSDGGQFFSVERAIDRALEMEAEGADIIDIGGESTRPNAPPVDPDEELRRLLPVLEGLVGRLTIPVSIDTYKASVAKATLAAGADIVNDVSGLAFDPLMVTVVAESQAGLVIMHTRGKPQVMQQNTSYTDMIAEIKTSLQSSLTRAFAAGISAERIVVDPGIGFGKSVAGNLEIMRRLAELTELGRPILVGPSRKSFIGAVLNREHDGRLFGTAAALAVSLVNGASIFRVHDVRAMRDVADLAWAICKPGVAG
jgi:dihydropteroate synthase